MDAGLLSTSLEPAVESPSEKRCRSATTPDGEPPSKRQKRREPSPPGEYPEPLFCCGNFHEMVEAALPHLVMTIDNASVLELWASVVTQQVHPDLTWETCLSAGNAISRLVRERVIYGNIYDINRHRNKAEQSDLTTQISEIDTMRFKLALQNNLVVLGGEMIPGDEDILQSKFATPEDYDTMKGCLEGTAKLFAIDYLDERALNIFDSFKPSVDQGRDPWSTNTIFNCLVLVAGDYVARDLREWMQDEEDL